MDQYFTCKDIKFSRLWHCFGNHTHLAPLDVVEGLLKASKSNVLPINTHRLTPETKREGMELGYAGITYDQFSKHFDTSGYIKMLNINLQTSAQDAIDKTKLAFDLTGEKVIKLEVLNSDRITSNQKELIQAARELMAWNDDLVVLPLLENDYNTAKELVDSGCPMLRIMGSAIGSCKGVTDFTTLERIVQLGVPVILDGGIGSVEHALKTMDIGITGVLINSMLFTSDISPVEVMQDFAKAFYEYLDQKTMSMA